MSGFILQEFKNRNTNKKIKVFIQYLYEKYGVSTDSEEFDNEYFSLLNEDDLIESLEYYIDKNNITAQVTASNYVTYITDFFDNTLSSEYGVNNEIFTNVYLRDKFVSKSKEIISKLKKSESKDSATDEEYEDLNAGINKFLNELIIEDIYDSIDKYQKKEIKYVKMYTNFVAAIALKLIMKFALGSATTISLELSNLDMESKTICVNGFNLCLDEELFHLFQKYLGIREYILSIHAKQENKLFIKYNGEPYIKYIEKTRAIRKDYSTFFKIMNDTIGKCSADLFTTRRVLEMLDKGIEISTIAKISDMSIDKCIELQNSNNNEEDINNKLQRFFNSKKTKIIEKKVINKKNGFLKCPFCGKETKAVSDEWILVQFENDSTKYLACRKCEGTNGK